jgi:hypothetical protein
MASWVTPFCEEGIRVLGCHLEEEEVPGGTHPSRPHTPRGRLPSALDFALGFNLSLGPLLMRLHFARPVDTGAVAGRPDPGWVTTFSIGIAGLNGFFDRKGEGDVRPAPWLPAGGVYWPDEPAWAVRELTDPLVNCARRLTW